ncbi:hypothetical protein EC957_010885, partial [Mortierella hygrophila]
MPGQVQPLYITLKRCLALKNSQLYSWLTSTSLNQVDKMDISISLTDEAAKELFVTWNLNNAFPAKLSAPSFDATSNEVAFEEIGLIASR